VIHDRVASAASALDVTDEHNFVMTWRFVEAALMRAHARALPF
jgi:hypothetical protein